MAGKLSIDQKLALSKARLRAAAEPTAPRPALPVNGMVLGAALIGASRSPFLRRMLLQLLTGPSRR